MKSNLFFGCTSADEVQLRYDELCKVFNGQDEMLNTIKVEYSTLMSVLVDSKPIVEAVKEETTTLSDIIKNLQEKVNPEGLRLEIVGKWLWLSGATFSVKEALKELGFRYSPDKKSWYWRSESDRSSNEKPIPLDMIKEKYGASLVAM
jgi:CTP synthase (UTP-ammonia lyase)